MPLVRAIALNGDIPETELLHEAGLPVRSDQWRRSVLRLAAVMDEPRRQTSGDFYDCRCGACGRAVLADRRIYPESESYRCDECLPWYDRLYNGHDPAAAQCPERRRDGYWFAICLNGHDPESTRGGPPTYARVQELAAICREAGLDFWSARGRGQQGHTAAQAYDSTGAITLRGGFSTGGW